MTETAPWDYVPAPESRDTAALRAEYGMFVDGRFREGGGGLVTSTEPATEQPLAEVSTADESDVDAALRAAGRAQRGTWGRLPGAERAKYLFRISRLVQERSRELAVLETLGTGRPVRSTKDSDLPAAAAHLFHHAGWADKLGYAGFGPSPRPMGVVAQVVQDDAPLLAIVRALAPALACGNTAVVTTPAPLSALVFADVCRTAGLPDGVLNVLPGGAEVGELLTAHPEADVVVCTGPPAIGAQARSQLAGSGRRLVLDPGGPDADIVFDDAPLDQAVDGVLDRIAGPRGRGARVLVQESGAGPFLELLRERVRGLRVGDPLDANTEVGALSSAERLARSTELVEQAVENGAELHLGAQELPERGFFAAPAVLTGVTQAMRIARERIPGPLLPVITFRTPDEAVAKTNNTPSALAVSVWSDKGSTALWTARRVRAVAARANGIERPDPAVALGGERSGPGRDGGPAGLETYLDV